MNKITNYIALHNKIIVVQADRVDGWCAYIGPVPGKRHVDEIEQVKDHGTKLPEQIARAIFPDKGGQYAK